jgi:hypothetical protein
VGPIIKDKTFFFGTADTQRRIARLSSRARCRLPVAVGWPPRLHGHYRQFLFDGRLDHKLTSSQNVMGAINVDRFYDDNPQDAVGGTNAPSVARRYTRRSVDGSAQSYAVINAELLNEARFAYLHGDPVTLWEAKTLSTTYTRAGAVPFHHWTVARLRHL